MMRYGSHEPPAEYCCGYCGACGVKLWGPYNSYDFELKCANCAAGVTGVNVREMRPDGSHETTLGFESSQIGSYMPAIPVETDELVTSFWEYHETPQEGVKWWQGLPNGVNDADALAQTNT